MNPPKSWARPMTMRRKPGTVTSTLGTTHLDPHAEVTKASQ